MAQDTTRIAYRDEVDLPEETTLGTAHALLAYLNGFCDARLEYGVLKFTIWLNPHGDSNDDLWDLREILYGVEAEFAKRGEFHYFADRSKIVEVPRD